MRYLFAPWVKHETRCYNRYYRYGCAWGALSSLGSLRIFPPLSQHYPLVELLPLMLANAAAQPGVEMSSGKDSPVISTRTLVTFRSMRRTCMNEVTFTGPSVGYSYVASTHRHGKKLGREFCWHHTAAFYSLGFEVGLGLFTYTRSCVLQNELEAGSNPSRSLLCDLPDRRWAS